MEDYSKYNGSKWFVRDYLKWFPKVVLGGMIYSNLLRKNKHTHYIVLPRFMGDSIWALSYLSAYKRQRDISHITIVGCTNIRQLCAFYSESFDAFLIMDKWKISCMFGFARSYLGSYLISFPHRKRVTFPWVYCNLIQRAFNNNPMISFPDYMKAVVYQIKLTTQPEPPHIPKNNLSNFIIKYRIEKGNTVFFNTEANSVRCDIKELFEKLAKHLIAKGFRVLTFTANGRQSPVEGTEAVLSTLAEAYWLSEYGGTLIGLRSGFLDVMVFANCKIIAIDDPEYPRKEFCDLKTWKVNDDCHTITYEGRERTCTRIEEILKIGE